MKIVHLDKCITIGRLHLCEIEQEVYLKELKLEYKALDKMRLELLDKEVLTKKGFLFSLLNLIFCLPVVEFMKVSMVTS